MSCYSPRVQAVLFGFRWFVRGGRGSTALRQQWHFIPLPTRAGIRWQLVWQGPRLGFVLIAETGRCVAMETPWVRCSCFCALLPTFRFSFSYFFLHPGKFISFVSLRLWSSHLLLSASTRYVFYSACSFCLCHLYPTPSRSSFVFICLVCLFFFRNCSFFSGGIFCCALLPVTLALDLPTYLDSLATFVFSLFHCDNIICISLGWRIRKDTGGTTAHVVG